MILSNEEKSYLKEIKKRGLVSNLLEHALSTKSTDCLFLPDTIINGLIHAEFKSRFKDKSIDIIQYSVLNDIFNVSFNDTRKDFLYVTSIINKGESDKIDCSNCLNREYCSSRFGDNKHIKHNLVILSVLIKHKAHFSKEVYSKSLDEFVDYFKKEFTYKEFTNYLKSGFLDTYVGDSDLSFQIAMEFFKRNSLDDDDFIEIKSKKYKKQKNSIEENSYNNQGEYLNKLKEMIGLEDVKNQIEELNDLLNFRNLMEHELNLPEMNLNCSFEGNPGTGKTMMAKIYADLLYETGFIKSNKLVCVSADGLIAEHIGGTAIKTANVIKKALGGVLFIDEAYQLIPSSEKDYSNECVATLVREMTEHKNNLVIIFAGYKDEMEKFININPGMKSRITNRVHFKDYTTDELFQIFKQNSDRSKFLIEDGVESLLKDIFKRKSINRDFGNARFVENLFQEVILKHSRNIMTKIRNKEIKHNDNITKTITIEDINSLSDSYLN